MGNRARQRLRHFASVRVFGTDSEGRQFARLAHTVDVSESGVRIAGIYVPLKKGQVVGVQQGPQKARFKVVWTGKLGSHTAGELGLQLLNGEAQIWNLDFPFATKDGYLAPEVSLVPERRRDERLDCELGVELRTSPDGPPTLMHCTDMSRGGCYLETWSPLPIGTDVYLVFTLAEVKLHGRGTVRTIDSSFGMGIQFSEISPPAALDHLLASLRTGSRDEKGTAASSGKRDDDSLPVSPNLEHARNNRVLLADDSRFLRNAYAMYLRRDEFETLLAIDGEEAYRLAVQHIPDVIVLDLLMPRIGGVSCLKILKDNPMTSHIPVIVLSGLPSSNGAKLLEAGAFAYVSKSQVGPEELPVLVKNALRSKQIISQPQRPILGPTLGGGEHSRF